MGFEEAVRQLDGLLSDASAGPAPRRANMLTVSGAAAVPSSQQRREPVGSRVRSAVVPPPPPPSAAAPSAPATPTPATDSTLDPPPLSVDEPALEMDDSIELLSIPGGDRGPALVLDDEPIDLEDEFDQTPEAPRSAPPPLSLAGVPLTMEPLDLEPPNSVAPLDLGPDPYDSIEFESMVELVSEAPALRPTGRAGPPRPPPLPVGAATPAISTEVDALMGELLADD